MEEQKVSSIKLVEDKMVDGRAEIVFNRAS
jgi:hypothetical protein